MVKGLHNGECLSIKPTVHCNGKRKQAGLLLKWLIKYQIVVFLLININTINRLCFGDACPSLCFAIVSCEWPEWLDHPEAEEGAPAADGWAEGPRPGAEHHGCLPSQAASGLGTRPPEGARPGAQGCPSGR